MASQAKQTVHSGATVLLQINGITVGRAQGLDARRSFGTEGVYEIGSIMPQEHIQNRYEGSFTVERYLMKASDVTRAMGTGAYDMAGLNLTALGEEILEKEVVDFVVLDKSTNKAIRTYHGCTSSDYSENFRTGAISGENATFYYLYCDSENEWSGGKGKKKK